MMTTGTDHQQGETTILLCLTLILMPLVEDAMDESTPWLTAQLQQRFTHRNGVIADSRAGNELTWLVALPTFEGWFTSLEEILTMTLGRRLAHAAAESEEWYWRLTENELPEPWFKKQQKRMSVINADWALRGHGQMQFLNTTDSTDSVLVAHRSHTSLAAGMANAAWERIEDKRTRFQWSDRGASETIIEAEYDARNIPAPTPTSPSWQEVETSAARNVDAAHPMELARHEADGLWTVEGIQMMTLHRDVLLRFESLAIPHLSESARDTDPRTSWTGFNDTDTAVFWDAIAEATRKQFHSSGELVLIAEAVHWLHVSAAHLGSAGLGEVVNAESVDNLGGVNLDIPMCPHPALAAGILLGCWERSEGRQGRCEWSCGPAGHIFALRSRREVAE